MTATNHALTGTVIGLVSGNPWLALPAAYLSHYICDAIPHYGPGGDNDTYISGGRFKALLLTDALLCVLLVGVLALSRPEHWLLAAICAFVATSPDLFWINRFRVIKQGRSWRPNWHSRFAAWIQWYERPPGAVVEVVWALAGITTIALVA